MELRKQGNVDIGNVWKIGNIGENQQERILQLLQELQEVCRESGLVIEYKFAKKGEQLISDKVSQMEDAIMGQYKGRQENYQSNKIIEQSKEHQENYQSNKIIEQPKEHQENYQSNKNIGHSEEHQENYRSNRVKGMKDRVIGRFKRYQDIYRENKEKKAKILEQYETSLAEIEKQYEKRVKEINTQKSICENQEQAIMLEQYKLKQERKNIAKSTPQYEECIMEFEGLKNKKEELKQLQRECNKELLNCEGERANSIIDAIEEKNNKLGKMKKQNIFQKIAGALINKKYDTKTKAFQENVRYIKDEEVPKARQRTAIQTKNFCESMDQKREKIVGKNQNVTAQLMQEMQARVTGNIDPVKDMQAKDTDEAIVM